MKDKMRGIRIPDYTAGEELLNSLTHGIAALLAAAGLAALLKKSALAPSGIRTLSVVCACIFGFSMILLYGFSCTYHALPRTSDLKKIFRVLDHCNIFLLVFGSYIPGALLGIGGTFGWILFAIVATVTAIGVTLTLIDMDRYSKATVACHLINGWSIVFGLKPLHAAMGTAGILYIAAGGVVYSIGAILYGIGKKKRYVHSVFHVFCVAATALQFTGIYRYIF